MPRRSFAGLIVVERVHTELLGYERDVRPTLFRLFVRKRAGAVYNVAWDHVADVGGDTCGSRSRGAHW
jgi:hypothetical protein